MIWMLDTNILMYFMNRKPGFERIARRMSGRSPGALRLSAITLAELRFGIERGEFKKENETALAGLLDLLQADDFPAAASADFGKIKAALASDGASIGPYDLLIAAHAKHIGATLVTNNEREFHRVAGLTIQNWAKA